MHWYFNYFVFNQPDIDILIIFAFIPMSCIILLILVIAMQLHKQLSFFFNRWPYCTHYSTEFNTFVYYLSISIKIYLSLQGNSTNTQKGKATREQQPLHIFNKLSIDILIIFIFNQLSIDVLIMFVFNQLSIDILIMFVFNQLFIDILIILK
jgi:hypothetical protein